MEVTIVLDGTTDELEALVRQLRDLIDLSGLLEPDTIPEEIDWGAHEAFGRLTSTEREIIRLDLRWEPRRRIAQQINISVGTVTVYRRSIRHKLRGIQSTQRPDWLKRWIRRFPGRTPKQ
ncbi:MAG TPA: LuxR C-terminal-related transcriptional regulator [Roseiflexaceae bacterium]|nr:LuxR C-terminal-related transcriptional regulator [Roseiflexaceae bacterium]